MLSICVAANTIYVVLRLLANFGAAGRKKNVWSFKGACKAGEVQQLPVRFVKYNSFNNIYVVL